MKRQQRIEQELISTRQGQLREFQATSFADRS